MKKLLSAAEVSEIIRVKPSTLAIWRSTGRYALPFVKSGRLVYYREEDVREFLDRRLFIHTDKKLASR